MSHKSAAAGALFVGLVLAGAASAEPYGLVVEREIVRYGDLDLSTSRGARVMLARIEGAASRVCAQPDSPNLPMAKPAMRHCRLETLARAIGDLDAPQVTAEYRQVHQTWPIREAAR